MFEFTDFAYNELLKLKSLKSVALPDSKLVSDEIYQKLSECVLITKVNIHVLEKKLDVPIQAN